jgi:1-aminocyclopropane-1-carboxylate deaminase/D-cysteine desulfhydrase-like pyridoxal-dependent ACC family enzyme
MKDDDMVFEQAPALPDFVDELISITPLEDPLLRQHAIRMDLLRLDLIHPLLSGNKWFKLKYSLLQAKEQGISTLLSFGGAYSNHLHALAYAGDRFGFKTIGLIRGDKVTNQTLEDCMRWGMDLHFLSRDTYRHRDEATFISDIKKQFPDALIIPEGGKSEAGRKGAAEILRGIHLSQYSHICVSVGSGTTLSGLIDSALQENHLLGFLPFRNATSMRSMIQPNSGKQNWDFIGDYHFGGFGKTSEALIGFINAFKKQYGVGLDQVYTGKMMWGIMDMVRHQRMKEGSSILFVHTGGLQGNRSNVNLH